MAKCGRRDMSRISRVSVEINDIEGIVAQVTLVVVHTICFQNDNTIQQYGRRLGDIFQKNISIDLSSV